MVGLNTEGKQKLAQSRGTRLLYDNLRYEVRSFGKDGKKVALIERFLGEERVVGAVGSWRMAALQELDRHFSDRDGRERGFRLFLAAKMLTTVEARRGHKAFEALKRLTLEETIFWVWQYHSYGERAIGAMKHIHLR